jgi:hypothetical protein
MSKAGSLMFGWLVPTLRAFASAHWNLGPRRHKSLQLFPTIDLLTQIGQHFGRLLQDARRQRFQFVDDRFAQPPARLARVDLLTLVSLGVVKEG